ncbi:G-protein coupled receptor GRL101-like [Saccostrea cucullata]|uniref:G-protein coupled receptor GRL101-like n=1 Tax=Saccostrea cuccullata TaxID=36930 RepID=UPI002ED131D7
MTILDLSNNKITHFSDGIFLHLENLQILYIQNNEILPIPGMFRGLFNIKWLHVDVFSICCAKPQSINVVKCVAPQNELSSCDQLINVPILNVGIWYIALLATFGNIVAFISSFTTFQKTTISYFTFCRNLSVADFLMGLYLYIIAIMNLVYIGNYGLNDYAWRHSGLCKFAGILATTSSEASTLFVLLITIDRVISIKYPFFQRQRGFTLGLTLLSWVVAIFISVAPILLEEVPFFADFYSKSPICISLPLSVRRQTGWQYSMVIFVGFNFIIFLAIAVGQIVILTEVMKSSRVCHSSNVRHREVALAKSVVSVVLTDLLCWIPIGIIGMLTFYGIDVSQDAYAWIIVLVLPVNSALNPMLYTLSTIVRERRRSKFERNLEDHFEVCQTNYKACHEEVNHKQRG